MPRFLDFLGGKERTEFEVDITAVEEWLNSKITEEFKEVIDAGNIIIQRLKKASLLVIDAAAEFSKVEIKAGELNQCLIPTIQNSRDSIVSKVTNILAKLDYPIINDFDSLLDISKNYSQSLSQIDQTLRTHGKMVFSILGKEIRPLLSGLKHVQRDASRLSKLVEDNSDKAEKIREINSAVNRLLDIHQELLDIKAFVEEARKGSEKVEEGERSVANKLEKVRSSADYKKSMLISLEVEKIRLRLVSLKASFDTAFSKLRKPLEKYGYTQHLKKEEEVLLKMYIESPSTGLMSDDNLILVNFLEGLKKSLSNGKISVKNSEKVLKRIEQIRSTLKSSQNSMKKTAGDLEDMSGTLRDSPVKKAEEIQKELEQKWLAKEEQATLIEKKLSDIDTKLEGLREITSKIEEDLSATFDRTVRIKGLNLEDG